LSEVGMETKNAVVIFEDLPIRKIFKNGETWISALDVAKALEYENPSVAVNTMVTRNKDRFSGYSTIIKMIGVEGKRKVNRESIFLNLKGTIAFCTLSKQKKAIPFQRWADEVLEKEIKKIPDDIRLKSKKQRLEFTDTLKKHGYNKPVEYATTTKQMKAATGIDENKPKSECDLIEIMKIASAEMLAGAKILIEKKNGFKEVHPVCVEAGKVIAENTKQITK
jgi:prophage antirepressor-like protein